MIVQLPEINKELVNHNHLPAKDFQGHPTSFITTLGSPKQAPSLKWNCKGISIYT